MQNALSNGGEAELLKSSLYQHGNPWNARLKRAAVPSNAATGNRQDAWVS